MEAGDGLRGATVCVTGAGGFIGANLCRALTGGGACVHAIVRPGSGCERLAEIAAHVRIHPVDLRDAHSVQSALEEMVPNVVFHAAVHNAYRRDDPLAEVVADNIMGTANLLDAMAPLTGARLVQIGSSTEYGPAVTPHAERDQLNPLTQHAVTKAAATMLVTQQARAARVEAVTLRLFSVYGLWEPRHRLVPRAIHAGLTGTVLPLTRPGIRRDYVFVSDVTEACLLAAVARGVTGEVINIGSGRETANEEMIEEIARVLGRRIRVQPGAYAPHATDTDHWIADITLAKGLLGWSPRHTLAAGLRATVNWSETHRG